MGSRQDVDTVFLWELVECDDCVFTGQYGGEVVSVLGYENIQVLLHINIQVFLFTETHPGPPCWGVV